MEVHCPKYLKFQTNTSETPKRTTAGKTGGWTSRWGVERMEQGASHCVFLFISRPVWTTGGGRGPSLYKESFSRGTGQHEYRNVPSLSSFHLSAPLTGRKQVTIALSTATLVSMRRHVCVHARSQVRSTWLEPHHASPIARKLLQSDFIETTRKQGQTALQ